MEAYIYTILIILLGLFLILLDIIIIPGGIVGSAGGILILITIYYGHNNYGLDFTINISALTMALSFILIWATLKFKLWSLMQHKDVADKKNGFVSFKQDFNDMIGKEGMAITTLRPAGAVKIENKRYDCMAQGEMISSSTRVIVTAVSEGQLVVKIADENNIINP